jgi:excisionase family DNA binding protein
MNPGALDADATDVGRVERLLRVVEVAEMLGVSPRTVFDRFERGDLPGFRLWGRKGGPVRFRLSEVEALLESWRSGNR